MVSLLHEALVELFRSGKTLACDLLRMNADSMVPADVVVENLEAAFNEITPTEYRADLVQQVCAPDGRALLAIVVEPQLATDMDKEWSWPVYVSTLRSRLRCPVALLIVAPEAAVARWAATPIELGPSSFLRPIVVGPNEVPLIGEKEAPPSPELAVLSALAHGGEQGGLQVVRAALSALSALDDEHARLYYDLITARLSDARRAELEAMILGGKEYEYQSDLFERLVAKGVQQGRAEGRDEGREEGRAEELRRSLLEVLELRGLRTEAAEGRIEGEKDLHQLRAWLRAAVTAVTTDDIFSS